MKDSAHPFDLASGDSVGDYRLEERIAEGGMGVVFAARALKLGPPAVVKVLRPELAHDPAARARFQREVRAARRLSHPNLLRLLAANANAPVPYLVLERVEGTPLGDYVRDREPGLKERVRIAAEAAGAVAVMHDAGVVHRDLKPANILIRADGEPVVIDLGLARIEGEDLALTRPEQAIGTPWFMAPEQVDPRLGRIGPATDVYQLGALLYFLVTGRSPRAGLEPADVYARLRKGELVPPREIDATISPELEAIVLAAMAHRPARRIPSARVLSEELLRFVRGEPTSHGTSRWRRWVDRLGRRG
ncbi:MAG: serine/threonine protein kinase [Planctomycetes bacterium]|nr:serine/threonine protein kinase [Planctomycetota bacterium]